MTPAARIEAAIDLIGRIEAEPVPAERVITPYMRARRYIGSKDRRAIGDLVYATLRARARIDWWLERIGPGPGPNDEVARPRRAVIAALGLVESKTADEIAALFDGGAYHPAPLSPGDRALAEAVAGQPLDHAEQPPSVRGECPAWLMEEFTQAFGDGLDAELAALTRGAPLDLRVNTLKGGRDGALAALAQEGIEALATPISPLGLRLNGRLAVYGGAAYAGGLVEVQDEGSQVVALLTDARPGMAVADLCAGAGGKTLALAACMENRGTLIALDIDQKRLDRAAKRLKRAGAGIVRRHLLRGSDPWLAKRAGTFGRVLVDAPCSGSGAWRRQPDQRWRLTRSTLAGYVVAQDEILATAAPLVAGGGRLVYATCSLLPAENARRVEAFLAARPDFTLLPAERVWAETLGSARCPAPLPFDGPYLLLTTARHGTDGFFAAVLERRKKE